MKVRSTIHENEVTVWLPLKGWPVISLSVVDDTIQHLLWTVTHESFNEATADSTRPIELTITRLSVMRRQGDGSVARTIDEIPLRYGIAPNGMRQTAPLGSAPPALRQGKHYVAVVRETLEANLRWFEFTAGETNTQG